MGWNVAILVMVSGLFFGLWMWLRRKLSLDGDFQRLVHSHLLDVQEKLDDLSRAAGYEADWRKEVSGVLGELKGCEGTLGRWFQRHDARTVDLEAKISTIYALLGPPRKTPAEELLVELYKLAGKEPPEPSAGVIRPKTDEELAIEQARERGLDGPEDRNLDTRPY